MEVVNFIGEVMGDDNEEIVSVLNSVARGPCTICDWPDHLNYWHYKEFLARFTCN